MTKKVLSLVLALVIVVTSLALPVMASSASNVQNGTVLSYSAVMDSSNPATFNITVAQSGNYKIKFNGGVQHDYHMDMTYLAELTDASSNMQSVIAVAPWTGNSANDAGYNTKTDSELGYVTLSEGNYTLKLTHLGGGSSKNFTLTFERVGNVNSADTYTVVKSFADGTPTYASGKNGRFDNGGYLIWNTNIEYAGDYDVYFYAGVESSSGCDPVSVTIEATKDETTKSCTGNAQWTGGGSGLKKTLYGEPWSGSDAGRKTHLLSRLGTIEGLANGDCTLKFSYSGTGVIYNLDTNKVYLVKRSNNNYNELISKTTASEDSEKTSLSDGNTAVLRGNDFITWENISIDYSGEYEVIFYGGIQNNTVNTDTTLKFEFTDTSDSSVKSVEGVAKWTGTGSKSKYDVSHSNAGWRTLEANQIGRIMLENRTYTLKLTNTASSHARFFDVLIRRVGDYVDYSQLPPLEVVEKKVTGSNIVLDFDREILDSTANLNNIEVLADNGTATKTVDANDTTKVIISGVTGDVWVKVSENLTDIYLKTLAEGFNDVYHVAGTKVTKRISDYENLLNGITEVSAGVVQYSKAWWALGNNSSVTFSFKIDEPGVYNMSFVGGAGTDQVPGTAKVSLSIGGIGYNKTFSSEVNFKDSTNVNVGKCVITEAGTYSIIFKKIGGSTATLRTVTLEKVSDLEDEDAEYSYTQNIAEYSKASVTNAIALTDTNATLEAGDVVGWNITPAYTGYYDISFAVSGQDADAQAYLDGKKTGVVNASSNVCTNVPLIAGKTYTISLEAIDDISVSSVEIERTSAFKNELVVEKLDIETADGVRIPYAIVDGFEAYAAVTLREYGTADDALQLIIAQYRSEEELVDAEVITIDPDEISDGASKKITSKLTFDGNGGFVKAFILKDNGLAPLTKAVTYVQSDMFEEGDFLTEVTYENAQEVLADYDGYDTSLYTTYEDSICKIEPIFFDSPVSTGQTKVFAYLGMPKNASASNKVPAIVLIHGAGGNANYEWVKEWNEKGFAAISLAMYGTGLESNTDFMPNKKKFHPFAGILPWGDLGEGFKTDKTKAGMYQNAINVYNAHTLLRSLEGVDADKIGVAGYSMGGLTTTLMSGVDDRFAFAVAVYGGGYLDQSKTYMANSSYQGGIGTSLAFDPANFAARAKMPVLYINNNYDAAFSIDSTSMTKAVTPNSYISIRHNYPHDGGWMRNTEQVYDFAKNIVEGNSSPYARITDEKAENGYLTANIDCDAEDIVKATLYYMTEEQIPKKENTEANYWKASENAYTLSGSVLSVKIPDGATYCYVTIEHEEITSQYAANGIAVSTKVLKVK